ncbi:MAG: hypothetical protein HQL12_05805 [Candidatus Omnitrophica bacterium]|nr:hypothetical protein [Candidatus Omnitrophota bacterium]
MTNDNNQENRFSLDEFSRQSEAYYSQIKKELESKYKGKYVAVDFVSKKYWLGETATEALTQAKAQSSPDRLFYLLQIGYPSSFSIQSITSRPYSHPKYDFAWSH